MFNVVTLSERPPYGNCIGGLLTGMSRCKPDFAALLWCVRDKSRTFSNPYANVSLLNRVNSLSLCFLSVHSICKGRKHP